MSAGPSTSINRAWTINGVGSGPQSSSGEQIVVIVRESLQDKESSTDG